MNRLARAGGVRPPVAETGGIGGRVVAAVATLALIGALTTVMLKNFERQRMENYRKAEQISLFGLQLALEKVGKDPSWDAGLAKTSYKEGWYTVSLRRFTRHDTLFVAILSEGHSGGAADEKTCVLARVSHDSSGWVSQGIR